MLWAESFSPRGCGRPLWVKVNGSSLLPSSLLSAPWDGWAFSCSPAALFCWAVSQALLLPRFPIKLSLLHNSNKRCVVFLKLPQSGWRTKSRATPQSGFFAVNLTRFPELGWKEWLWDWTAVRRTLQATVHQMVLVGRDLKADPISPPCHGQGCHPLS